MGKNVLNVQGQISMGENCLPSQAYTSMFKVYSNGSCRNTWTSVKKVNKNGCFLCQKNKL